MYKKDLSPIVSIPASSASQVSSFCVEPALNAGDDLEGFDGADKTFLLEFSMPHDPAGLAAAGIANHDMPAVWLLNARIPYTVQYHSCNCWRTGCGEFDVFEVLSSGNTKAKSTIHSKNGGGDSNYFNWPVAGTIRVAVVYDSTSESITVSVLENGALTSGEFPESMTTGQIQLLVQDEAATVGESGSRFRIAG